MSITVHASGVDKPADLPPAPVTRALISVFDKTGVLEFARGLHALGVEILSTGGTARMLAEAGVPVIEVSDYTGFPEMLDGRVKTLHPKVHGGLLARRDLPAHMAALEQHGIGRIDLLAVNLYPFQQTVARPGVTLDEAIENIDIGGPAMLRAAAKNHAGVTVIVDPADYQPVLQQLQTQKAVSGPTRFNLAVKAYGHTAQYDGAVANHLSAIAEDGSKAPLPATLTLQFERVQPMRYGENPHQFAAFYREAQPAPGTLATYHQLQGKELSYNNIADADAAYSIQQQEQQKTINIKTVEAEIEKTKRQQILSQEQIVIRQNELSAEVEKRADAEKYQVQKNAEADLEQRKRIAEAQRYEAEQQAMAQNAASDATRYKLEQEAQGIKAKGEAEAYAILKKGEAEAQAMDKKAEAYKKYNNAAVAQMMIEVLPQIVENVAKPISAIKDVNIYSGDGNGISAMSGNVPVAIKQAFDVLKSATGVDMADIMKAGSIQAKTTRNINLNGEAQEVVDGLKD